MPLQALPRPLPAGAVSAALLAGATLPDCDSALGSEGGCVVSDFGGVEALPGAGYTGGATGRDHKVVAAAVERVSRVRAR